MEKQTSDLYSAIQAYNKQVEEEETQAEREKTAMQEHIKKTLEKLGIRHRGIDGNLVTCRHAGKDITFRMIWNPGPALYFTVERVGKCKNCRREVQTYEVNANQLENWGKLVIYPAWRESPCDCTAAIIDLTE